MHTGSEGVVIPGPFFGVGLAREGCDDRRLLHWALEVGNNLNEKWCGKVRLKLHPAEFET